MTDLRRVILDAVERARSEGVAIRAGMWGVWPTLFEVRIGELVQRFSRQWSAFPGNCACPMGAVLIGLPAASELEAMADTRNGQKALAAAEALGVDVEWVQAFTYGFDRRYAGRLEEDDALFAPYELGWELRDRLLPDQPI